MNNTAICDQLKFYYLICSIVLFLSNSWIIVNVIKNYLDKKGNSLSCCPLRISFLKSYLEVFSSNLRVVREGCYAPYVKPVFSAFDLELGK